MSAKGEDSPWFLPQNDPAVINLEHVLPERPEKNWPGFTDEDVAQYSKRLGNLVLMRSIDNSNLRSSAFSAKKPIYGDSPYELTHQVADEPEWTVEAIVARQRALARIAVETWPIDGKRKSSATRIRRAPDANEIATSVVAKATDAV